MNKAKNRSTIGIEEIATIPVGEYRKYPIVDYRHGMAIRQNTYYYNQTIGATTGTRARASIRKDDKEIVITMLQRKEKRDGHY